MVDTMFQQIIKHFLKFEPLTPLISELNPKFGNATLCVLNGSLLSQNFVSKSYLYQTILRKTFGGSSILRSGRVNCTVNENKASPKLDQRERRTVICGNLIVEMHPCFVLWQKKCATYPRGS